LKKYAVIGTHGIGKSTYSYQLAEQFKKRGENVFVVQEHVRMSPFPINDAMRPETAIWTCTSQMAHELEAEAKGFSILVCDRSVYDPFLYCDFFQLDNSSLHALREMARHWLTTYDHFYFLRSNLPIKPDGIRSTDDFFQKEIDRLFEVDLIPLVKDKCTTILSSEVFNVPY
jgi:thymidylate kinase